MRYFYFIPYVYGNSHGSAEIISPVPLEYWDQLTEVQNAIAAKKGFSIPQEIILGTYVLMRKEEEECLPKKKIPALAKASRQLRKRRF